MNFRHFSVWLKCPNHFWGPHFGVKIKNEKNGKCDSCICLCSMWQNAFHLAILHLFKPIMTAQAAGQIFLPTPLGLSSFSGCDDGWWVSCIICPNDLAALPNSSTERPAASGVRRAVPPRGPWEEARVRRAAAGSVCQRSHCVWSY